MVRRGWINYLLRLFHNSLEWDIAISFMKDFPSINIIPGDVCLMTRGKETGRSSAVTQGRFLGRSGPAHNSAVSHELLVSLPWFPLGWISFKHLVLCLVSGFIDKIRALKSYLFPPSFIQKTYLQRTPIFIKLTLPFLQGHTILQPPPLRHEGTTLHFL